MRKLLTLTMATWPLWAGQAAEPRSAVAFKIDDNVVAIVHQDGRFDFGLQEAGDIAYDPAGRLVVRAGGVEVAYDAAEEKVSRVGTTEIVYDEAEQRVVRVGSVEIAYDPTGQRVVKIGGATLTYDEQGQHLVGVQGQAGKGQVLLFGLR